MAPTELKAARARLGLSAAKLAERLELGANGGRTVRRWEDGTNPVPGPVRVAIRLMLERVA
jgi:DNA-binding transcriptional regulator YiaG